MVCANNGYIYYYQRNAIKIIKVTYVTINKINQIRVINVTIKKQIQQYL